jgi:hypothetical protein
MMIPRIQISPKRPETICRLMSPAEAIREGNKPYDIFDISKLEYTGQAEFHLHAGAAD